MSFRHAGEVWRDFPQLVAGVVFADGVSKDADVEGRIAAYAAIADERLAGGPESELAEIQAWRRAFSQLGLKPTQYRCASESLLRRYRKERVLPRIHPLIDLCNAISLAYAIPVAVLDLAEIALPLEVRYADGDEDYLAFSGETEHPDAGEMIFADHVRRAHARRWTNRQSARSAVRDTTSTVLVVAEALHPTAPEDLPALIHNLTTDLAELWPVQPRTAVLTANAPEFLL